MSKWMRQFRFELQLIVSNKFYIALPVLFGLWMVIHLYTASAPWKLFINTYDFSSLAQTMTLGVAVLLGMLLIRPDKNETENDLPNSWPLSSSIQITAKFAAGWVYLSSFTVVMIINYLVVGIQEDSSAITLFNELLYYTLQYEWSYAFALTIGIFVSVMLPHRLAYLIGFGVWILSTFFLDLFVMTRFHLYFLKVFHLNEFTLASMLRNDVWGIQLFQKELWLSRLFVAILIIMLIVWIVVMLNKRRPVSTSRTWMYTTGCVAVLLCLIAYVPFGMDYQERFTQLELIRGDAPSFEDIGYDEEDEVTIEIFPISAYDIEMEKQENNRLKLKVSLTLKEEDIPIHEQLTFTLHSLFEVTEVRMNNDRVNFERKGVTVSINRNVLKSNNGKVNIQFEYQGQFRAWGYDAEQERMYGFVHDGHVYMPSYLAWYPMSGSHVSSAYKIMPSYHLGRDRYASDFNIRLSGFESEIYSTAGKAQRMDESPNQQQIIVQNSSGVSLIAGNVTKVEGEGAFSVVTAPMYERQLNMLMDDLQEVDDYFSKWLGPELPKLHQTLFYVPVHSVSFGGQQFLAHWLDDALIFPEDEAPEYVDNERYESTKPRLIRIKDLIYCRLFKGYDFKNYMNHNETVAPALLDAFYYVYLNEHAGLEGDYFVDAFKIGSGVWPLGTQRSDGYFGSLVYSYNAHDTNNDELREQVRDALMAGKTDEVKEVLLHFYPQMTIKVADAGQANMEGEAQIPKVSIVEWQRKWDEVMGNE